MDAPKSGDKHAGMSADEMAKMGDDEHTDHGAMPGMSAADHHRAHAPAGDAAMERLAGQDPHRLVPHLEADVLRGVGQDELDLRPRHGLDGPRIPQRPPA